MLALRIKTCGNEEVQVKFVYIPLGNWVIVSASERDGNSNVVKRLFAAGTQLEIANTMATWDMPYQRR
ncbi:uncharacterized protein LOC116804681 isoform X4 [Drosophila mojavensis]|uniref:uncharacterized protein LOC116804681 isoform X4 n=1 Tax=Drosophila mojavensis TaxID=7230 RepID=UPI0013EE67E6|nr:uncharacterized protein LOC116804681 isoform X4 [Drosophila mojavensis]